MNGKHIISLVCILVFGALPAAAQKFPNLKELKVITQLPPDFPQRVGAIAYDGMNFWFPIVRDKGNCPIYNPITDHWSVTEDEKLKFSIKDLSSTLVDTGGMVFAEGRIWFGSAYGRSYGWIDQNEPEKITRYRKELRPDIGSSKSYADFAFDGKHIWAAWHAYNYKMDRSKTQLLLKIDKDTGEVIAEFALPPGQSASGSHGLTWDGSALWHIKENKLTKLDREGAPIEQFDVPEVNGASGLAWDGKALWIVEFTGKLWKLPFTTAK